MDPDGKRAALLEAGEALFSQRGFASVTIADIAGHADVAVGSVYRLFPDKAALLAALHARMEDRFIDVMQTAWASQETHDRKLRAVVAALLMEAAKVAHLMPLYSLTRDVVGQVDYRPGERTIAAIAPLHAQGQAAGALIALDTQLSARLAYALIDAAMHRLLAATSAAERSDVIMQTQDLVTRAFMATSKA
jgi:AcrR family transcriptional regulator